MRRNTIASGVVAGWACWPWPRPRLRRPRRTGRHGRSASSSAPAWAAAPTSSPASSRSRCPSCSASRSWSRTEQGAGNIVAAATLVNAPKDGYTAYMMNNSHGVSATLFKSLPLRLGQRFRDGVADRNRGPRAGDGARLPGEGRQGPDRCRQGGARANYNFASVGIGTTQHFSGELFRQLAGVDIKHIPYRGTPAAITGLAASEVAAHLRAGAAGAGADPLRRPPGDRRDVAAALTRRCRTCRPSPKSGLPAFQVMSWYGLAFPAGTPRRSSTR